MRYVLLAFVLLLTTPLIPMNFKGWRLHEVDFYDVYTVYNGSKIGDECAIIDFVTICDSFGYNPNHVSKVIEHESGYNPRAVHHKSGASGLIQFMPSTAKQFGTNVYEIRRMGFREQLLLTMDYLQAVEKSANTKIQDSVDMYLAVFYPVMLSEKYKPEHQRRTVIFSRGSVGYGLNKPNDRDRNGVIDLNDIGPIMSYPVSKIDTVRVRKSYRTITPIKRRPYDISL